MFLGVSVVEVNEVGAVVDGVAAAAGVGAGLAVNPKLNLGAVVAFTPEGAGALSGCFISGCFEDPNANVEGKPPEAGVKALLAPCEPVPPSLPSKLLPCCCSAGFCTPKGEGAKFDDGCALSLCAAPLMVNADPPLGAGLVLFVGFGANISAAEVPDFALFSAGFAKKFGIAGPEDFWPLKPKGDGAAFESD